MTIEPLRNTASVIRYVWEIWCSDDEKIPGNKTDIDSAGITAPGGDIL